MCARTERDDNAGIIKFMKSSIYYVRVYILHGEIRRVIYGIRLYGATAYLKRTQQE